MTYRIGRTQDSIVVPAGFVTDLASVPPRLHSIVTPLGPNMLPAIVHDYLYWTHGCKQAEADRIFDLAMRETRVTANDRKVIMTGLGIGAKAAFEQNARERRDGYTRVLPPAYRNIPRTLTWPQYRSELRSRRIPGGPEPQVSTAFCAWGQSARNPPGVPY
ncbi:MAG TPA: DUF1353 domain-containing protein [Longimicrobium sp.]